MDSRLATLYLISITNMERIPSMLSYMKEIRKIIDEEVSLYIYSRLSNGKTHHMCLCCGFIFRFKSRCHHFCSRGCYSKFHRIPGFIRRIVNRKD